MKKKCLFLWKKMKYNDKSNYAVNEEMHMISCDYCRRKSDKWSVIQFILTSLMQETAEPCIIQDSFQDNKRWIPTLYLIFL